jgi:hypothetical protein
MTKDLPAARSVDVGMMSRMFNNTTNSYKLVFFQALLKRIGQSDLVSGNSVFTLRELAIEMAAIAWYPHTFFHLSFGLQDQLGSVLSRLDFSVDERSLGLAETQRRLRDAIATQYDAIGLESILRFAPYRLLQPFFEDALRGRDDVKKNRLTHDLANQAFMLDRPVLYRFVGVEDRAIELHPEWVKYIQGSLPIIEGWVLNHWTTYLQGRNPNTPAIPNKITPPLERSALKKQTFYWRAALEATPIRCLYSNEYLTPDRFALDHFIPWSFVCHDQLWNLVPVQREANSAKGNRLPAERYIKGFIDLQIEGLERTRLHLSEAEWEKATESFVSDLRISHEDLTCPDRLRAAYLDTVPPLISLACRTGFSPNWDLDRATA